MVYVLVILGGLGFEGVTNSVLRYLEAIDHSKINIELCIAGRAERECLIRVERAGIKYIQFADRSKNPLKYFLLLTKLVKKNKYDIVHVHGNSATLAVDMFAAFLGNCGVRIAHSHNTMCLHPVVDKLLRPLFNLTYTDGFACSEKAGKWLFGNKKFTIVPNGINVDSYAFSLTLRERIRQKLGLKDEIIIEHIGCFNNQKNQEFLVKIFADILQTGVNSRLILVGEGDNKSTIEELAENLQIKDKIIFYGISMEVHALMSAADVFVLPSYYEGLPCVLIEAQASGLPCIVSKNVSQEAGITSLVKFISLDEDQKVWLAEIINSVGIDRRKTSDHACEILKKVNYDIEICSKMITELYLLKGR